MCVYMCVIYVKRLCRHFDPEPYVCLWQQPSKSILIPTKAPCARKSFMSGAYLSCLSGTMFGNAYQTRARAHTYMSSASLIMLIRQTDRHTHTQTHTHTHTHTHIKFFTDYAYQREKEREKERGSERERERKGEIEGERDARASSASPIILIRVQSYARWSRAARGYKCLWGLGVRVSGLGFGVGPIVPSFLRLTT